MNTYCRVQSRRWLWLILLVLLCFLAGCGSEERRGATSDTAYTVVDSEGTLVRLPKKPTRIITGNLSHDTVVAGLVPARYLVVVNSLSRSPTSSFISNEVKHMKEVTTTSLDIPVEMVVRTHPDVLVLPDHIDKNTVDMLRGMGYPVVICKSPNTFEEIRTCIRLIAATVGEPEKGEKMVAALNEDLKQVDAVLSRREGPSHSALLVSQMQSYGGPVSIYDTLITRAGIRNSIAEAGLKNGEPLSKELILKARPDCFIISDYGQLKSGRFIEFQKEFLGDPALQSLPGVQHIVPVPNRYIYCANQNAGRAVMALANAVYGPLFDMEDEKNMSFADS